jgi:hypothetical protein
MRAFFPSARLAASGLCAALLGLTTAAHAAGRVVVVPVAVGSGAEPNAALMTGLVGGLKQTPQWSVELARPDLLEPAKPALTDEELAALDPRLAEATGKLEGSAEEASTALLALRTELLAARKKAPLGERGEALGHRAAVLLVAARLKEGKADDAKTAADEAFLLFPGRKIEGFEVAAEARELVEAPRPDLGSRVTLKTLPEGCEMTVGGVAIGKAPATFPALSGATYHTEARCAGATEAAPAAATLTRRLTVGNEATRQELLDLDFDKVLRAEGATRLRFATPAARKQNEETYARRLAERFDAEAVVLASIGELSSADWLNGRLYLRSGYLNRQGLVRLEAARATALGRFLATGKDTPGVLKPEEANLLISAAASAPETKDSISPWYTDVPGWCFTGVGLAGAILGFWTKSLADARQAEADEIRGDFDRQQKLYRSAQNTKFWSGVGIYGGLLTAATGVALLAIPEYDTQSELFVVGPSAGGLSFGYARRF